MSLPPLSSATTIKFRVECHMCENAIGYMVNKGNSIYENSQGVILFTSAYSGGNGLSIIPENFHKVTTLFTARKSIKGTWINDKDEYIAPNESHPDWQQFVNDSIVYSLFNNSSQQSSLRQVEYKDKLWDIKNEFFWLSNDQMKQLANDNNFDELYQDAKFHNNERFVYEKLKEIQLSNDAQKVLNKATELLIKSIPMRKLVHNENPEYHLNTWDAGYAQLKLVWKKYYKDEFNEFREMYKQFENRLIPLVYELGFLRK